jgi:hypothetical protein
MKLNLKILTLFFLLTILSCKEKQNVKSEDDLNNNWEELEISTRTEKIIISKFSDSAKYEQNLNNIAFKILPEDGKIEEEEIVKKNIYFTKSEKDSLAKYIYESITEPKFTDILATEYAGSVSLKYNTGGAKLICEYNSVGDWSVVSDTTKKIYKLISKKAEISKS